IAQMPYTIASRPQRTINPKAVMESSILWSAPGSPLPGRMWRGYAKNRPPTQRRASVPIPKFVHPHGKLLYELRNQRDTSNSMILVPFRTRSSQSVMPRLVCELRVRGTSQIQRVFAKNRGPVSGGFELFPRALAQRQPDQ